MMFRFLRAILLYMNTELIFEVIQLRRGGYAAQCLNASIETRATDLQELHDNISSAVDSHFEGRRKPDGKSIHLMMFRE